MGQVDLKIEKLLLDLQNPRFERAKNQHDALQKILDDQEQKLFVLAESIIKNGLNPMDRPLIRSRQQKYCHRLKGVSIKISDELLTA